MYNKYNSLDGNLMNNPADSLVILYRKDRSDDWQSVPFDKQGSPYVGYIEVPDMQTGEYTLAVWDELFVKVPEIMPNSDTGIKIYPNPASDMVIMEFAESVPDAIYVYNAAGLQVDSLIHPAIC